MKLQLLIAWLVMQIIFADGIGYRLQLNDFSKNRTYSLYVIITALWFCLIKIFFRTRQLIKQSWNGGRKFRNLFDKSVRKLKAIARVELFWFCENVVRSYFSRNWKFLMRCVEWWKRALTQNILQTFKDYFQINLYCGFRLFKFIKRHVGI